MVLKCLAHHPQADCYRSATAAGTRTEINDGFTVFQNEAFKMLFFEETNLKLYLIATFMDRRGNTIVKCSAHHSMVDFSRSAAAAGTEREINCRDKVFQQEALKLLFFKENKL